MTSVDDLRLKLPDYVPIETIRLSEDHQFLHDSDGDPETIYALEKAPFDRVDSVGAIINGIEQELTIDSDVTAIDTTGDGRYDSIEFINSDTYPDEDTDFTVTYDAESVISRYVGAYDTDTQSIDAGIDGAIEAKHVDTASGDELDLIGSLFGPIGRRGGRGDGEYRSFLRSIVQAFNARGTESDLKQAVAAAIRGDPESVRVEEDYEAVGFEVFIDDVEDADISPSVNELVRLAKPSGVELLSEPVVPGSTATISLGLPGSTTTTEEGLGSGSLGDDDIE